MAGALILDGGNSLEMNAITVKKNFDWQRG